jgi:hypothetical protein
VDYRRDIREMGRFLRSDELSRAVHAAATEVRDQARTLAAVEAFDTGQYRDSLAVERLDGRDRVGWAVVADDEAAAAVEFGNRRTGGRGRHILTRAAEAAGLEIQGRP